MYVDVSPESSTSHKLKGLGRKRVRSVSRYCGEIHARASIQDGMFPGRDSKWALPAYDSEALPVFCKCRRTLNIFASGLNVVCAHGSDM